MEQTSRFIRPLLEFIMPGASDVTITAVHSIIRKFAHVFEYGVLAILAAFAFRRSSKNLLRRHWPGFATLVVLVVASIDEFNQSLEPTRTGTPRDVMLDLFGGIAAIALFWLASRWFRRRISSR